MLMVACILVDKINKIFINDLTKGENVRRYFK
jgi:hypothetical protein